jgi:hypothetical protein
VALIAAQVISDFGMLADPEENVGKTIGKAWGLLDERGVICAIFQSPNGHANTHLIRRLPRRNELYQADTQFDHHD